MASIRQLDPIVASRIAAGEVVERPSSVLRELLDNSIDAKATKISIYIEEGGIKSLTVIDNGVGMDADDLLLACESHATSKVRSLDDLFNLKTLGFRGEALSSIAACSRLTISSNGNSITVDNGKKNPVVPGSIMQGTSVCMEDLFENIPARRLFLKRPQSEASECRKTLIEKALGFENIEFLFFSDGELKLHFEPTDRKNRSVQVFSLDKSFVPAQILQMSYKGENESLWAVCSDPGCHRRDRTQIRILVNNRIIDSYQFVQAITNAYSAALPGGAFPYFHLFIDANPALVDFNIHPTKRECKLRNQSAIYGAITTMIRNALVYKKADTVETPQLFSEVREAPARPYTAAPVSKDISKPSIAQNTAKPFDSSWFESAKAILSKKDSAPQQQKESPAKPQETPVQRAPSVVTTTRIIPEYRYIGQVFNTFLVVEMEDKLLFIDQHALHERLLYDEIRALKDVQRLIVPYSFEVERSVDDFLIKNSFIYSDFGIELTRREDLVWDMASIPAACRKNEEEIVSFIRNQTGDLESVQKGLFAIIACHAAIKAGDPLDNVTATSLVKRCFELDRMVCPHGREFTFSLSKQELYRQVGRIV